MAKYNIQDLEFISEENTQKLNNIIGGVSSLVINENGSTIIIFNGYKPQERVTEISSSLNPPPDEDENDAIAVTITIW